MGRNGTDSKAGGPAGPALEPGYWRRKTLAQMSDAEWEALCDGCGRCCLVLIEEEDVGDIWETDVHCRLYDPAARRCRDYANRHENVPDCVRLSAATVPQLPWMPETCAYRLVAEGRDLFDWHPLVSGDPDGAAKAGVAVPKRGTRAEDRVSDALEDRITRRRFKAPRRRG